MNLTAGMRLKSATCDTEIIVVKAPQDDVSICCGGQLMTLPDQSPETQTPPAPEANSGTQLGKRYVNADATLEVLCTKSGDGSLSVGDTPMPVKEAKPLPASD